MHVLSKHEYDFGKNTASVSSVNGVTLREKMSLQGYAFLVLGSGDSCGKDSTEGWGKWQPRGIKEKNFEKIPVLAKSIQCS